MRLLRNIATLDTGLPIRQERFEGRPHLVAPVVALVEGVHVGSGGALFYPGDEIAKYVEAWNGIPLPVFHPEEYGSYVSANSPEQIEARSVGRFFNVFFDPDGSKLKGELWIDIGKAEKIAPEVLSLIRSSQHLEVSTALWSDDDNTPGQWRDEEFAVIARNYRPDHLALLPGGEGACSWADGCGVRVNNPSRGGLDMELEANVRRSARTPSFDGAESTSWANVTTTFATYRDAYFRGHGGRPDDVPSRVQDASAAIRNWIASKTLLGEGGADNERDLIFFPVVNPRTGKLNEGALRAVITGRGAQARIPAEAKASAQRKARSLLNKHFGAELEVDEVANQESWAMQKLKGLIRSMARAVGLTVQELSHEELRSRIQHALDALDNAEWRHFVRDVYDDSVVYEARGTNPNETGSTAMVMKLYRRGFSEDENGQVELKDDAEEVKEERTYVPVENKSANQIENKKQEEVVMEEKKQIVDTLISCDRTRFEEGDREWLTALEVEQLDKLKASEEKPPEADEEEKKKKELEDKEAEEKKAKEEEAATNATPTVDDYIAKAPDEIQGVLHRAVNRDRTIKDDMVKALLANERNSFTKEELEAKGIGELERLIELGRVEHDYSGQAGGQGSGKDDEVPAMPPTFAPATK